MDMYNQLPKEKHTMINQPPTHNPQLRILNEQQCQALLEAAFECLERVGVEVKNSTAVDLLLSAGARPAGNAIYKIPAKIIQDALAVTPPGYSLWARDYEYKLDVRQGQVYFGPGPTCSNFMDPFTGEHRLARRGDAGMTARVCDALPNIDYVMGLSMFSDVPPGLSPVYEFAESIANTRKPIVAWAHNTQNVSAIYQMAVAVAGGEAEFRERPTFALFSTYKSPLQHTEEDIGNLLWAAQQGIPLVYLGGPTMGLESPCTGAGSLVLHLAAALSGVAIVQLLVPGTPMAIGGVPMAMDLRTVRPAYGSPEMSLHVAAATDLARYLNIPFMGTGGASESKLLDAQAGAEVAIQLLVSALSGATLVHDVGFLDCADIGSLSLLVLSDEVIGMVKRIQRGVPVNAETIMMDLIEQIGPGGYYIAEQPSASLCRKEFWIPKILDRDPYSIWSEKGGLSLEDRAREKVQRILNNHQPPPLPEGANEIISAVLLEAENQSLAIH
jgi:trimethylamine---corrinoid protein Co-methyltransferase